VHAEPVEAAHGGEVARAFQRRPHQRGYAASRQALLLGAQQTHGNRYVQRLIQRVLQGYVDYYNMERPHRSLGPVPPLPGAPPPRAPNGPLGRVVARPVLGGLHHVYRRAA
jgi:hypothetical protein